jgi:predicted DNA repair protein MutK
MAVSLLALIDDIATILDDVALMTKVAAKKTAGVLGDDLALNAQQVSGVKAARELPVVWSVAKGSFKNKLILVPLALAISAIIPWLITPLLMIGGAYLCFEGFEKLAHKFLNHQTQDVEHQGKIVEALIDPNIDLVALEKEKIKGAIRTDFVLSAEIIVIALGTVKDAAFSSQVSVVTAIAIIMTIGVYGLVAGIVKLDDGGLALIKSTSKDIWGDFQRCLGSAILWFAPMLMKTLSVVGTAAMFLVGGSIVLHGIPYSHHIFHYVDELVLKIPMIGNAFSAIMPLFINGFAGILIGAFVLAVINIPNRFKRKIA